MNSDTFCLAPWSHSLVTVETKLLPCCLSKQNSGYKYDQYDDWWTSETMSTLRSDLLNGVKNSECQRCWKDEQLGKESLRQGYNNLLRSHIDFAQLKKDITENTVSPATTWELDVGNLCNLKCIMCNPIQSDKIQTEVNNNKSLFKEFPILVDQANTYTQQSWIDTPEGQELLEKIIPDLRWLKLQGGEALSIKRIRDLIENLDGSKITLSIVTNGTVLDTRLVNSLSKYKKVEIAISVEAAGHENDVIRYGSDWSVIENNIKTLVAMPNVEISLNHVLQITSVLYLPSVIEFAEKLNLPISVLSLTNPDYLSLNACPPKLIAQLQDSVNALEIKNSKNSTIKQVLQNILATVNFEPLLFDRFLEYVELLDKIRPTKLADVCKTIIKEKI